MKNRGSDPQWQKAEYERVMGEEKLRRQVAAAEAEREHERQQKRAKGRR